MATLLTMVSGLTVTATADEYERVSWNDVLRSGNFEYVELISKETNKLAIEITRYIGSAAQVVVPSTIDGKTVREIYERTFRYKKNVTSITLPDTIVNIGTGAFNACTALESITVSANNKKYSSKDGVLYNKNKTKLIVFPSAKKVTTFKIPNSVTAISEGAFYRSKKMTNLYIPATVKSIHREAFLGCSGLKKITVAKNNKKYSSANGVLFDKKKTILLSYPAGKTNKIYAIPKTVVKINYNAFSLCKKLTTLKIPKSVKCIERNNGTNYTFFQCIKLKNVYYNGTKTNWNKIYYYEENYEGKRHKENYLYSGKSDLSRQMNNAKIHYNAKF